MNAEMWKELRVEAEKMNCTMTSVNPAEFIRAMDRIERHILPERVAKILEKVAMNTDYVVNHFTRTSDMLLILAQVLQSGDLSEIEKWVKP